LNESASIFLSLLKLSVSSRIVVHVVNEADSSDPGVIWGVSPTDNAEDFLAFFSRYFLDSALKNKVSPPRVSRNSSSQVHTLTSVRILVR